MQLQEEERQALRSFRRNKGLRLEDLADDNLSISSISNIEKGNRVREGTLEAYFSKLEILGLKRNSLFDLVKKERKLSEQLKLTFMLLESKIELNLLSKVMPEIREMENKKEVPKEYSQYLKGKFYLKKRKWDQAKAHFEKVIEICKKNNNSSFNLIATSYKELARISFYERNDIQHSLVLVDEGLQYYDPDEEKNEIRYYLLIGKVSYLEKLNQTDEALHLLKEMWSSLPEITDVEIQLNMYEIMAALLNKKNRFTEALSYAKHGFSIAVRNQKYRRSQELLTILGNIYVNLEDHWSAENCYKEALTFEEKTGKDLLVSTYAELGLLYKKMKQFEEAERHLQLAVKKGSQAKDAQRYCYALMSLAKFYLDQKSYINAIEHYKKAKELARQYKLSNKLQSILVDISECWKRAGYKENYYASLDEFQNHLRENQ
ncbi:tetratricopeptide repeat protein [Shimazuella sp. AN120528]|uniref:XRE family transcriptional regulator n=1 Tax=Shimazuella soli TaxID=1892854 RepID=UPI001F10BCE5|nr:XRE family transcriptional regulator [Shimazuella soli]MCH5584851.1 tetratricopeptide repeat protein [Shimazuella soli]